MEHKFFDDNYRKNWIKKADFKTLNNYLKSMEKLSKKDAKYLEIYNKDMDFLINDDIFEKVNEDMLFNIQTETFIGNTETNIKNINKMMDNNACSDKCKNKFVELNHIEICIRNEHENAYNERNVRSATKNFIDIIMTCSDMATTDEHMGNLLYYFKIISSLMKDDKIAIKEGYKYFSYILKKNQNKINIDFIKKLNLVRNKKQSMLNNHAGYKQEKDNLINTNIDLYGIENILTTILFNKIYNEYKNIK